MPNSLTPSRFAMWRAVVAMVHADGVVTPHELSFIQNYTAELPLTPDQRQQIADDLKNPQDINGLFDQMMHPEDKRDFFALARALSWCDGDLDAQEVKILEKLTKQDHVQHLLEESRMQIQEVELCENQWNFKTERSKSLFGFLNFMSHGRAA